MKVNHLLLISLVLLSACSSVSAKTNDSFPTFLMMNAQDLPAHWKVNSFTKMDVKNAESYAIEFSKTNIPTEPLLVQHQLSVYQTVDAAKQAYPDWEKKRFPTEDWVIPEGFNFHPKDNSDASRLGCLSEKVNGQPIFFCAYLQQHKNLISLVSAKLDGKNLDIQQLVNAVEILDIRLQQN